LKLKLFSSRKGFELQFNWMFVLIAGAVFLFFFFLIIRGQVSVSDEDSSLQAQSDFGFILRSSQGSRESEKKIPFNSRIEFSCRDGVPSYGAPGSPFFENYQYLVLFTPHIADSSQLLFKTMSLKAPFAAASLSYLTTGQVSYVFLDDGLQSKYLFSSLPQDSTRAFHTGSVSSLEDHNFDQVVIVFDASKVSPSDVLNSNLPFFAQNRHDVISLVEYENAGGTPGSFGTVRFYTYSDAGFSLVGESYYFSQLELLGAVYSGSYELYSCEADKINARLGLISELYSRRAAALSSSYPSCGPIYTSMIAELDEVKLAAKEPYTISSAQRLFESSQNVHSFNLKLVDTTSCALLY
jgi:hypothetical protein